MPKHNLHDIKLPPPLMTSEPGSFARKTIVERKPQIIDQVIEDNDYTRRRSEKAGYLQARDSLPARRARWSRMRPGVAAWNRELAAYQGRTWLDLPWYFAEAYFYRRLLEAVGYFQPGPQQGQDPFGVQKRAQIERAVARLAEDWDELASAEPRSGLRGPPSLLPVGQPRRPEQLHGEPGGQRWPGCPRRAPQHPHRSHRAGAPHRDRGHPARRFRQRQRGARSPL